MHHRGRIARFLIFSFLTIPLFAQQPPADERMQQLEKRLDTLARQAAEIRQELDRLKAERGLAPTSPAIVSQPSEAEDLTKVEVATTSAPTPGAATAATSIQTPTKETPPDALTDVQTANNVSNPGLSKLFNPDTSVIGNFLGKAGNANPYEYPGSKGRSAMLLDEAEFSFEAFVDPYAKAKFFLSVTPEGASVEEGYANFVNLPYDLTAKVGRFKAFFGKDNTWHAHVRPWADQPLVIHNLFGDEGFSDSGISVSRTISNPWNTYLEATGEVFNGDVEGVFDNHSLNDLVYNAHLKAFRDITENSNLEVGTSYARGTLNDAHSQFSGIDVTYRWKPLQQGIYKGLIARMEAITDRRGDLDRSLKGFYTSLDYQVGQRWFTGVRVDSSDRFTETGIPNDKALSATLTFWPSEFSQIRGQARRVRYGDAKAVNELLLQLVFAIGAHGAHTF
ncbi:MAG: hypothetical protein ABIP63_10535 [Thermoanaerobaculia bacterium]